MFSCFGEKYDVGFEDPSEAVQTTPSRMGNFARKCLQDSVLTLVRGTEQENDLRRMLRANCRNDEPSGGAVSKVSQLNLYAVDYALRHLGLSVAVVGATCMDRLQAGWLLGRWSLGQKDGRIVGGICWLTDDAHAAPLTGDYLGTLLDCVPAACSKTICPWEFFAVGALKKKAMGEESEPTGRAYERTQYRACG